MKTTYFQNCQTLDEAKKRFWELAKINHPDKGGDTATFQEILNEFQSFKPNSEKFKGEFDAFDSAEYAAILNQLIAIPEIVVEVCGSWVWVSGNTKPHKEEIKKVETGESYRRGFSNTKSMWYFSPTGYRKRSKAEFDINEIRNMYGSTIVPKSEKHLTA